MSTNARECQPVMEAIEWSNVYVTGADQNNVIRALMIGDSICGGYFSKVDEQLSPGVKCASYQTSKFVSNPDFLAELEILLNRFDFAVLHVNNGLHGGGIANSEYEKGLTVLFDLLEKRQPRATIIFALSTPVRKGERFAELDEVACGVSRERNRIASALAIRRGYAINDLYSVVENHPEWYTDGVHFNDEGRSAQASRVADVIRKALAKRP
jgi:hypothetical protein